MKTLFVLPSYNESENIVKLIKKIIINSEENHIVVVDDNSPDNTSKLVLDFINKNNYHNKVHIISRKNKSGRGSAVLEGFKWGLKNTENIACYVEMDCDFSHSPDDINKGKELSKKFDFVIGSRYPHGIIINWSIQRRIFSFFANQLIRLLISRSIADYTNGFRFYSSDVIKYLLTKNINSTGYICLSEIAAILLKANYTHSSFAITFRNRIRGKSNLNLIEIINSLKLILKISWSYRFGKL